jgi:hypothetical protein
MKKSIDNTVPEAPKPTFEQTQKHKLCEAWSFKVMREQEMKERQDKMNALQEEFKAVQVKFNESAQQKHDIDIAIQIIAGVLTEMGLNPQQVLNDAFAPQVDAGEGSPEAVETLEAEEIPVETQAPVEKSKK